MLLQETAPSPSACVLRRPAIMELLRFSATRRLVVIAPHPDDETLAAGGLIFDLTRAGWQVSVVVVTDGAASHRDVRNLREIREAECRKAVRTLGLTMPPTFLGFPDGETDANIGEIAAALHKAVGTVDVIVGPRTDDWHSDHRATANALDIAFDASGPALLRYAIWGWEQLSVDELNIGAGETFEASPAALDAKKRALQHYESQTTLRYGRVILSDAMVQRHTSSTEVFWW